MKNLLVKIAKELRCFYNTLILVDYEKNELKKEIEKLKREIKMQQMVMTFNVKLHEYLIIKEYAESMYIEFDEVRTLILMFCKNPCFLSRYGIPAEHCVNRNSVLKYCKDFLNKK